MKHDLNNKNQNSKIYIHFLSASVMSLLLFSVTVFYLYHTYQENQYKEAQTHLQVANQLILKEIGSTYLEKAINIDSISQDEYEATSNELQNLLDILKLDLSATCIWSEKDNEAYITLISGKGNKGPIKKLPYFTPFFKVGKPEKNYKNGILNFVHSPASSQCFDVKNKFREGYSCFQKVRLSNGKMAVIVSSLNKVQFREFINKYLNDALMDGLLIAISFIPFVIYIIYLLYLQNMLTQKAFLIDSLTQLPNINSLKMQPSENTLFFYIDLEFFSQYNRLYGHEIGNDILQGFAVKLHEFAQKVEGKAFRLNGDKFGLLLSVFNKSMQQKVIEETKQYLNQMTIKVQEFEFLLTTKIGISTDSEFFLENAYDAVRIAKEKGLHSFQIIGQNNSTSTQNLKDLKIIMDAIASNYVKVYYQPIVDNHGTTVKYEALMRIETHDEILFPSRFLKLAKISGHYYDLSLMVFKQVIEDINRYNISASINIAYDDIDNAKHAKTILNLITMCNYPRNITLEILESSAISNFDLLMEFIAKARKFGVKIAIDDYGADFSSLQNILNIHPDILKVDGSIVKYIVNDKSSYITLRFTTHGAQQLGMKVIAEYVASEEIFNAAKKIGVDLFQGYYFSEPKPLEQLL